MTAITRFRGNYAFLSNFYSSPIEVAGITFPTVEHAFQASKLALGVPDRHAQQRHVARKNTPAAAKQWGRTIALRADWKTAHLPIMRRLLALKFSEQSKFCDLLLDTGSLPLIEGNDWNDTYWGVCNGKGRNQLGVLLMERRAELAKTIVYELDLYDDGPIKQALALHDAC
jgi:ribA/ribD-fused uncharacterized protein